MQRYGIYILVPLMATFLVSAQAVWGYAIKNGNLMRGSPGQIFVNLVSSPGIWFGGLLYALTTVVYFIMLSRGKFFIIQLSMAAVSTVLATILASVVFKEHISSTNIIGMVILIIGLGFVIK